MSRTLCRCSKVFGTVHKVQAFVCTVPIPWHFGLRSNSEYDSSCKHVCILFMLFSALPPDYVLDYICLMGDSRLVGACMFVAVRWNGTHPSFPNLPPAAPHTHRRDAAVRRWAQTKFCPPINMHIQMSRTLCRCSKLTWNGAQSTSICVHRAILA